VWDRLHQVLLTEPHRAGRLDWSRAVMTTTSTAPGAGGAFEDSGGLVDLGTADGRGRLGDGVEKSSERARPTTSPATPSATPPGNSPAPTPTTMAARPPGSCARPSQSSSPSPAGTTPARTISNTPPPNKPSPTFAPPTSRPPQCPWPASLPAPPARPLPTAMLSRCAPSCPNTPTGSSPTLPGQPSPPLSTDAHKAGLDPTKLLTNERDRRELDSTDSPAATVLWSIRDQAATRINARAGAAASRSTHTKRVAFSDVARSAGFTPPASDASRSQRRR